MEKSQSRKNFRKSHSVLTCGIIRIRCSCAVGSRARSFAINVEKSKVKERRQPFLCVFKNNRFFAIPRFPRGNNFCSWRGHFGIGKSDFKIGVCQVCQRQEAGFLVFISEICKEGRYGRVGGRAIFIVVCSRLRRDFHKS